MRSTKLSLEAKFLTGEIPISNEVLQEILDETGFEAKIELVNGVNEIYELISNNRIKDITDPRYSNQNFLQKFGVS